jgi:hypothetical protein
MVGMRAQTDPDLSLSTDDADGCDYPHHHAPSLDSLSTAASTPSAPFGGGGGTIDD